MKEYGDIDPIKTLMFFLTYFFLRLICFSDMNINEALLTLVAFFKFNLNFFSTALRLKISTCPIIYVGTI